VKIGVLALQGAFQEHIATLRRLKIEAYPIRLPKDLEGLDGLIIPGGESTSIGQLMEGYGIIEPVRGLAQRDFPVMGTCAGLILLGKKASDLDFEPLGVMDIEVRRNAFGRQVDSFESNLPIPVLGETPFPGVFIRAPIIERVGDGVEVLARLPQGPVVAARQGRMLVAAFHPELTRDLRFHAYFLNSIVAS
jgi:5'-phosphate synthase pdxT subunit